MCKCKKSGEKTMGSFTFSHDVENTVFPAHTPVDKKPVSADAELIGS